MTLDELKNIEFDASDKRMLEFIPIMVKMPLQEVSEILYHRDPLFVLEVIDHFKIQDAGKLISELSISKQIDLFKNSSKKKFAKYFENMPSDDRADLFQHLSQKEQVELLPFLTKEIKKDVIHLSNYPPETAGGIMKSDYVVLKQHYSVEESIDLLRNDYSDSDYVNYIYIVNDNYELIGYILLRDLVLAKPSTGINQLMKQIIITASVDEDQEEAVRKIEKYDLLTLPVLNKNNQIVGIITQDNAIDVLRLEQTEDMEKFMGMTRDSSDENYLETSVWSHFKKRVVWIVSLAIVGLISGLIIHSYESTLDKLLILALYMPMVADTGGNCGSQAATVVIRAMALGQFRLKNWFIVIWKESRISLLLAICLGFIAFGKVMFLSWETETPDEYPLAIIAFVIALALSLQTITATVIGAALPLTVKAFGGDPAVAASPAITTTVDITGLLIYFAVATSFFNL